MVGKSKLVFSCYAVGVILYFGTTHLYFSADTSGDIPAFVGWVEVPGVWLAAFCLVGIHSEHFLLAAGLTNIATYLLTPYLLWKIFMWITKPRASNRCEDSSLAHKP